MRPDFTCRRARQDLRCRLRWGHRPLHRESRLCTDGAHTRAAGVCGRGRAKTKNLASSLPESIACFLAILLFALHIRGPIIFPSSRLWLIRLWRSWQDADKAAEPPKPNTPQILWMMGVCRLINAMLVTARLGSKTVLSQNGYGSVHIYIRKIKKLTSLLPEYLQARCDPYTGVAHLQPQTLSPPTELHLCVGCAR